LSVISPLLGESPQMRAIARTIVEVADTDATVLIRGDCGVGKEFVARTIHAVSARRDNPFVKVNCAAIPAGLLESELFGHERGAFTGAHRRRPGQFEHADQGTLFLDEIAELPRPSRPSCSTCFKIFASAGSGAADSSTSTCA